MLIKKKRFREYLKHQISPSSTNLLLASQLGDHYKELGDEGAGVGTGRNRVW